MIRAIEGFIDISAEYEILLRAVTCLANVLSALNRRWHNRSRSLVSTAEVSSFVKCTVHFTTSQAKFMLDMLNLRASKSVESLKIWLMPKTSIFLYFSSILLSIVNIGKIRDMRETG